MEEKRVFLVQTTGRQAVYPSARFEDRTYAQDLFRYGNYRHEFWDQRTQDRSFGDVRIGDLVIQYCASDVVECPLSIKYIHEVEDLCSIPGDQVDNAVAQGNYTTSRGEVLKTGNFIIKLRIFRELNNPIPRSTILALANEGKLSDSMKRCGQYGFNIGQVTMTDFNKIIELDNNPEPGELTYDPQETQLRDFFVEKGLGETLGQAYSSYELLTENGETVGVEYDTGEIGRIDLLYKSRTDGSYLVIELKKGSETPDHVVGQLARYMGFVRKRMAQGAQVNGVIVCKTPSRELIYSCEELGCTLFTFNWRVEISRVPLA